MDRWKIEGNTGRCATTDRVLAENEEFYAVLFEEGEGFRRADYSLDAWNGPPDGAYCFFRSRVPARGDGRTKRPAFDIDLVANFFLRLADETETTRLRLRFALALMLLRKRVLRYEKTEHDADAEYWHLRLVGEDSVHRVRNPQLTDEQLLEVSEHLEAILGGTDPDGDRDPTVPAGLEEQAPDAG